MTYQRLNNLTGWGVFLVAMVVYLLTVAPTASFWDCGEFIACSNELEVTHPPGAPLFLLVGRVFAMLAFNDVTSIAFMVNMISVLSSAFTALFVCWTTTMLAQKGLQDMDWDEQTKNFSALASGAIAGLTTIFADPLWFSAVEAEVYAMSFFFTALVVWLMFKWEARADEKDHLRWIILIAYVMGLSIGVHLLNLLTIPALATIYYLRKFPFSLKGLLATLGISVAILAFIQYGIIQYTFSIAWWFERLFTGTAMRNGTILEGFGMPKGTGSLVFALLLIGAIVGLIAWSAKQKKVILNTAMICFSVILIGFSSYSVIFIRSNVEPGIDMNNPENILTFLSYMKREQYGDRPLLKGPMYNGRVERDARGYPQFDVTGMKYILLDGEDRYVEDVEERKYKYEDKDVVFFPRMYETGRYKSGPFGYINYVDNKGRDKESPYDDKPTRGEDFEFFLDYQLSHMYVRYFMWNFVGRQSDVQEARWEDGLIFNTDSKNKGNNHYYFLPLLLGLMGLIWHIAADRKNAFVIGMLFFFTGVAIIMYLNQWPSQPRERDYSYAGSFQTFAIWVGLGVIFLVDVLWKYLGKRATVLTAVGLSLIVPTIMAVQNWDDHTRKGRYIDIEFAKNLLNSCEENAILFTGGDNDTFPLWYIQEVEGYRTDVRLANLELLISDWYIDQMKQPKNAAQPLPISMEKEDYAGERDLIIQNYPSRKISLPVDKDQLLADGVISEEEYPFVGDPMVWEFKARGSKSNPYILRKDSVIIDILRNVANDGWQRPVYFANTMAPSNFLNLNDYLRMEGMAYRVLPVKRTEETINDIYYGRIAQDILQKNLTEKFLYTNLDNPSVNFDEHIRSVIVSNYRNSFFRLCNSYSEEIMKNQIVVGTFQQLSGDPVMTDSLELELIRMQEEITSDQNEIRKLVSFMDQFIPSEVIPMPLTLSISFAQILQQAGIEDLAEAAFGRATDQALAQLSRNVAAGVSNAQTQNSMAFRTIMITIQSLAQQGKIEDAQSLANRLEDITGNNMGTQLLQQIPQEP